MYEKVNWVGSTQRMFAISQKNSRKAILLMKLQVLQKNYGVFDIFSSNYVISNHCPCLISNVRMKLKKKIIAFSSN